MPEATRSITHCGTIWTLRRKGGTARAEIIAIEGVDLELRYTRSNKRFVRWCIYADGGDLLGEAAIERFDLEAHGWTAPDRRTARVGSRSQAQRFGLPPALLG